MSNLDYQVGQYIEYFTAHKNLKCKNVNYI
jgi:hypothetical protein